MSFRGSWFKIEDFSGGETAGFTGSGNFDARSVPINTATSLDNIIIFPEGAGFRARYPTLYNNATEFGSADGYPVVGVGYLGLSNGNNYVLTVKNNKVYSASAALSRSATYTDRTGAVSITGGASSSAARGAIRWFFCTHNDLLIGFGGAWGSAADSPIKWAGDTNNIAALGGSPPLARFGFSAANRVFGCNTSTHPSTVYWSVLGNPEDWTGTGSGSVVIGSLNDGEPVVAGCPFRSNLALIFKPSSIHVLDLSAAPFPTRILFNGVGTTGPGSIVAANDMVYFMTPQIQMKATNGNTITDFPPLPYNTMQSGIGISSSSVLPRIFGFRLSSRPNVTVPPRDLIVWCGLPSTGDGDQVVESYAWDLNNKCWLRLSTGFQFVSGASAPDGNLFGGWTNQGRVFVPDSDFGPNSYTDDTNLNSGAINCYWQSGWLGVDGFSKNVNPSRFVCHGKTLLSTSGSATLTYGYDFGSLSRSASLSLSGLSGFSSRAFLNGVGKYFRYRFSFSPTTLETQAFIYRFLLSEKSREKVAA